MRAAPPCSQAEARELTDRLRAAMNASNILAANLPAARRTRTTSSVYFVQTGVYADDPVKIGVAQNVQARVAQLQTGSPHELRLLGTLPGGEAEERELHQRFAHLHIRGEWFEGAPELLAAIAAMTQ